MPNDQSHDPRVALAVNRLAAAVALSVSAVASGGGTLPITIPSFGADEDPTYPVGIVAGSYFVDGDNGSDANNGIRVVDGGTGPFATVQKACSVLTAGDTCYVRASTTPYSFLDTAYGSSIVKGHVFANSGTSGSYIRLIGYPGERPIIDQQNTTNGIHFDGKEYIQVLNFEIRNCFGSGFDLANGYAIDNNNIVIKFCDIHGMDGNPGDNVGGIKSLGAHNVTFSDNKIYNVRVGGVLNDNGVGFSMYDTWSHKIENNEVYDVQNGVIHKTPPNGVNPVGVWRFNLFHDMERAFYHNNNDAEPAGDYFDELYITQNIVYNATAAFYDTADLAQTASQKAYIFNNTFIDCDVSIRGFQDVRIINNIGTGSGFRIATTFETGAQSEPTRHIPSISDVGHNCWSIGSGVNVSLDNFSATKLYTSLAAWQAAYNDAPLTLSDTTPGVGSIVADPLFVDAVNRDYRLQGSSPALNVGRGGVAMGAYITGSETIGASW